MEATCPHSACREALRSLTSLDENWEGFEWFWQPRRLRKSDKTSADVSSHVRFSRAVMRPNRVAACASGGVNLFRHSIGPRLGSGLQRLCRFPAPGANVPPSILKGLAQLPCVCNSEVAHEPCQRPTRHGISGRHGSGSRGTGGLRSGSVKALSVPRFPAVQPCHSPMLASRQRISSNWTNLSTFATLCSMVSRRVRPTSSGCCSRNFFTRLHTLPHQDVPLTGFEEGPIRSPTPSWGRNRLTSDS